MSRGNDIGPTGTGHPRMGLRWENIMSRADYVKFTKKQANVVYAAYKRGDVKMTRKQVTHLYNCVGTNDFKFSGVCSFICEGRLDLAQAILDGHKVEAYEVKTVVREELDEDDPFFGMFDDDNFIEFTTTETHYRIVA